MIRVPSDYRETRAFGGGSETLRLTPGGHICKIRSAHLEKVRDSDRDMLVVEFDIDEGSAFDGFYKAQYDRKLMYTPTPYWNGIFRSPIATSDGRTNPFFKGFITAVEDSNLNYSFEKTGFDEQTLKGKMVGFNFGEEEYQYSDRQTGEQKVGTSCKPKHAVSVEAVRNGIVVPPAKKMLATRPAPAPKFEEVQDVDLPF